MNFVPLSGIDVNVLHNVNHPTTTTTTTRSNYMFHSDTNARAHDPDDGKESPTKAVHRLGINLDLGVFLGLVMHLAIWPQN